MDSKKAEALLRKYWEGKTDLNDERELKRFFLTNKKNENLATNYFKYINKQVTYNPLGEEFDTEISNLIQYDNNKKRDKNFSVKYWYIAASFVLIASVSIIFKNEILKVESPTQIVEMDTYQDPEKALEETRKVILFISSKLNQSNEYAMQFSKFEQNQNTLKQK